MAALIANISDLLREGAAAVRFFSHSGLMESAPEEAITKLSGQFRSMGEGTHRSSHLNMWRVTGLLQDPAHPLKAPIEAATYGVTKCVCCCRCAGRAVPN